MYLLYSIAFVDQTRDQKHLQLRKWQLIGMS